MADFLLMRHAATSWNEAGRIQGRTDIALSPAGRNAARGWRPPPFARNWPCVSSPLARAMETAATMGLAPRPDPAFVETDWGRCDGQTLQDLRSKGGDAFAANERRGLDFRPEGGESPREVGRRALGGLRNLPGSAVIVTHKGVVRALLAVACGWDMRGRAPVRLLPATAHHFRLPPDGDLTLVRANISLAEGAAP